MFITQIHRLTFSLAFIVVLAANAFPLGLHTFHTSLARIDYNAREKLVEISIQLFMHDLIPALERRAKRKIDLEKTPDADRILFDFVNENFVLNDKADQTKKLVFVGKEVQVDTVYVYVETPADESFENYNLKNTFFFDSFPEQVNLVVARFDDKKADLLFKSGDKFKKIEAAKPSIEN